MPAKKRKKAGSKSKADRITAFIKVEYIKGKIRIVPIGRLTG